MCVARLRPPRQPPDGPRATGPNSMGSPPCGGVHRSSRSRCDGRDVPPKGTCRVRESSPCPVLSPSFETGIWTAHIAPCSEPSLSVSQDPYTVAGHVHYLHPNQSHLSVTTARLFVATRCGCFCTGMVGGWEGFRGHGGVTPWGPLSYLPLHLLRPLTPFENTTPHSLGFHGCHSESCPASERHRTAVVFSGLVVFTATTRPSWFRPLELHVLQQLSEFNLHVLFQGRGPQQGPKSPGPQIL